MSGSSFLLDGLAKITRSALLLRVADEDFASEGDPALVRMRELVEHAGPGNPIIKLRPELVADSAWFTSSRYATAIAPARLGEPLYAACRHRGSRVDGLVLVRRTGEPAFDDEDRAVVALFLAVYGEASRAPALAEPEWVAGLPPRLRRVFELLLTELSEKEIASHTGLSYATTHQYVVEVYRRGGLTSRAQLMARLLRPGATIR